VTYAWRKTAKPSELSLSSKIKVYILKSRVVVTEAFILRSGRLKQDCDLRRRTILKLLCLYDKNIIT
jgi:hypothetical protein